MKTLFAFTLLSLLHYNWIVHCCKKGPDGNTHIHVKVGRTRISNFRLYLFISKNCSLDASGSITINENNYNNITPYDGVDYQVEGFDLANTENYIDNQGKGGKHGLMDGTDYQVEEFDFLDKGIINQGKGGKHGFTNGADYQV